MQPVVRFFIRLIAVTLVRLVADSAIKKLGGPTRRRSLRFFK